LNLVAAIAPGTSLRSFSPPEGGPPTGLATGPIPADPEPAPLSSAGPTARDARLSPAPDRLVDGAGRDLPSLITSLRFFTPAGPGLRVGLGVNQHNTAG
jgi:hypothetical protein